MGQKKHKMSLENLVMPESKEDIISSLISWGHSQRLGSHRERDHSNQRGDV